MSSTELTSKIRELRELQAFIEEAEKEVEKLKDVIKAFMGDMEELRTGEYKVTWRTVKSLRFDATAFKRTHKELYDQYSKTTTVRRFIVA